MGRFHFFVNTQLERWWFSESVSIIPHILSDDNRFRILSFKWNELQKIPFDRVSAQGQVIQNALKYPELLAVIIAVYFSTQGTVDIRDNLEKQLMVLLMKEGWPAELTGRNWCWRHNRKTIVVILRLQDAVFCENIPKSDYIREK